MKQTKEKAITLIALVITIIIIVILAGVTIQTLNETGLMEKTKQTVEENKKAKIKEELQLAINEAQIELTKENNNITIENIIQKLKEKLKEDIEISDNGSTNGKYKNYEFYIDKNTLEVILGKEITEDTDISKMNSNYIILSGETYIDTRIKQEELIKNDEEFTIATSVYINKDMQSKINNMDILGNHLNHNGFVWQFYGTSSKLELFIKGLSIQIDYTPYYEKWTEIVLTYKNGTVKIYFDDELLGTNDNMTLIPYGDILIGTGYLNENRAMQGAIKSVKIWGKELTHEQIKQINYNERNTEIQKDDIIREINFNNEKEIKENIIGINYRLESIEKEIGYEFKWCGGNYLDINLPESDILENSEFTIAARVKINSDEQKSIQHMGILGNHNSTSGILWQFDGASSDLFIGIGTQSQMIKINYSEYYDKFIDMVMIYKNKKISVYIDKEKVAEQENIDMVANGKIYIGDSWGGTDRGMKGYLPYVKIWNKALDNNQIGSLKLEEKTNIEKQNIIKELDLKTIENINSQGTLANNYYKLVMTGK